MKYLTFTLAATVAATPALVKKQANNAALIVATGDMQLWGQITPYTPNNESYFGVQNVGLPNDCQVEQVHLLERHGSRFPTAFYDDGNNDDNLGAKVMNASAKNSTAFSGPLSFLNGYQYNFGSGLLIGLGAQQSFAGGIQFWQQYGRILYNATAGQLAYNATYPNGTARVKPTLRTTSQSRIYNSEINWALGFFGTSFQTVPNPTIANATTPFNLVVIPEGGTENNTLASYDSCPNSDDAIIGSLGDLNLENYIASYLKAATARLQPYVPAGFNLNTNDTYAMQSICAYETNYLGSSSFCGLFTLQEWQGFEASLDIEYYYDYSFGNPTGRAQGIGYVIELLSRLTMTPITSSNSSVNSTTDSNSTNFPLNQKFYADFSHDDIIISVLTALSLDYLHVPVNLTQYPPDPNRPFVLSHLTPFAAKFVTEVIGCGSSNPTAVQAARTYSNPTRYGYNPNNATNKFIRMRLNNGILPISTIRGGACGSRTDGLCALPNFIQSQSNAYALSNYNYSCNGAYTIKNITSMFDFDGTINATTVQT